MDKDKHGKHKESCKRYQSEGRREKNKVIKKQKHERRIARFAKRRDEGKRYVYNSDGAGTVLRRHKVTEAEENKAERIGEYQRWARAFGKLEHQIATERERVRAEEIKNRKSAKKGSKNEKVAG